MRCVTTSPKAAAITDDKIKGMNDVGMVLGAICAGKLAPDDPRIPYVVKVALRRVRAGRKLSVLVGGTPFGAAGGPGVVPVGMLTCHFSARELMEAGCCAVFCDPLALREAIMRAAAHANLIMEASAA